VHRVLLLNGQSALNREEAQPFGGDRLVISRALAILGGDPMPGPPIEVVIPARLAGKRLDEILAELRPERTKSAWQKQVRRGEVKLDGKRVLRSNIRPPRRGKLSLASEEETQPLPLEIVHEDQHLVVVDKPPGLLTHGRNDPGEDSIATRAVARFPNLPTVMGEHRPGIVHRLDRETSGLIIVARTLPAMERLREQFRERSIAKTYRVLVHGAPRSEELLLDSELGPCAGHPDRQEIKQRGKGKTARTEVKLVERLEPCSLLHCKPSTGRRHQIRVHLWAAGMTVVGDLMYGAKNAPELPAGTPRITRHLLHAARLAFDHPITGERIDISAPDPPDLADLIHRLRARRADRDG
jgi:23S rRNA pseudouridine1911/1915/1917 synthase